MQKQKVINWSIFILLSFIWGSSFILMKVSKEDLTGVQIGAVRIFSAGFIFLAPAIFHISKVPVRKIPLIILSGILGNLLPAFLFAIAIEKKIDSSLAGILNSLTPLFVIVINMLFYKAKLPRQKIAGVVIGFIGLLVLSFSEGGISFHNSGYALLILVATLLYGINVNLVSHYLRDVNPIHMATISLAIMSFPAGVIAWQQDTFALLQYNVSARWSFAAAALLGVVGSAFATVFFYYLIKKAGGLFATMTTYAIPIVAIFWGILANENVTAIQIFCLGVILGGVYLANKS
ncbi:DMT family transporter [Chitinophagaceae bacterium LB-8]|uniref:DMT family transporter n=1 Tax=Paraflavisolibacter caeni TaxID=2982496 RepID=A0A9X2XT98_9BACT|nr:DMT family transporter [Paraflavisolibacter caeni]MCU7547936.1 DMT family transporter [Paraflavisolibacter caeni]